MNFAKFNNIKIQGIASCVPSKIISNEERTDLYSEKDLKTIIKTTAIKERRFAEENVCASDLGFKAAKYLIEELNEASNISCVLFLSQTPDYKIPFSSNILQSRLELSNKCLCVDINAGCNGFISGLQIAYSIINGLEKGKVLLILAETMSKIVSLKDKSTALLFGDGASALLISKTKEINTSFFSNYSDGHKYDTIIIPDGGYRNTFNEKSLIKHKYDDGSVRQNTELYMDGFGVFVFTKKKVRDAVIEMNEYAKHNMDDIDYYIFHQANKFIIDQIRKKLNIDQKKILMNIDRFGNTSAVSIPLVITTELENIKNRKAIHCSGFGSGLSWGNAILDLNKTIIFPIIEY